MQRLRHPRLTVAAGMLLVVLIAALAIMLRPHETGPSQAELDSIARADSAALHVGLVTNADCLPLFYAERRGMMGEVRLHAFESQMDCDTAVSLRQLDVMYTDAVRAVLLAARDSLRPRLFASLPTRLTLVQHKKKRAKRLAQMKDYIIGMERHAAADIYAETVRDSSGLDDTHLFFAQINDPRLRYKMVAGGQIETALLVEPFTTLALKAGCKTLWRSPDAGPAFAAFALTGRRPMYEEAQRLVTVYAKACDELLHSPDEEALADILLHTYGLTAEEIEGVRKVKPTPLQTVDKKALRTAREFLLRRGRIPQTTSVDSLTTTRIHL